MTFPRHSSDTRHVSSSRIPCLAGLGQTDDGVVPRPEVRRARQVVEDTADSLRKGRW